MGNNTAFGGSCACGRMTYKCSSKPMACAVCHCVTCRKLSGAAYQAFAVVKAKDLVFHDNNENRTLPGLPAKSEYGISLLKVSRSAERAFCADCHTPFGMRYMHSPDAHSICIGSVDEDSIRDEDVRKALEPGFHIFVSQKTWWCGGIGVDGMRTHDRFTGTFEDDIKAWEDANPPRASRL